MLNKYLMPADRFMYFKDSQNHERIYGVTPKVRDEISALIPYGLNEPDVSPDVHIKAYPLKPVKKDNRFTYYDIEAPEPCDFPLYRIDWLIVIYANPPQ